MCGIVGYIGTSRAVDFLLEGLGTLEYRGYDSSGVATVEGDRIQVTKSAGRISALAEELAQQTTLGHVGIGHTRWATHGPATAANAHPHIGGNGTIAVVHNGIIENYRQLKNQLLADGYVFHSDTDTEVVAHLLARELESRESEIASEAVPHEVIIEAVQSALQQLNGAYGLVVLFRDWPEVVVAARLGSPIVIGIGDDAHYIASDKAAFTGRVSKVVHLQDHEVAAITASDLLVVGDGQHDLSYVVEEYETDALQAELDGFPHYMLKEIYEQPDAIRDAMRGRLDDANATAVFGGLTLNAQQLRSVDRIVLTGCGTSWHAALVGEYLLESFARVAVEVEYASELRYRNPPVSANTLIFAITQSGETSDTLAAMREMQRMGHPALAICNVVGSSIAREADGGIYTHAGPEIGVASTKAYTTQCTVLALLALGIGRLRHLDYEAGVRIIDELRSLPEKVAEALTTNLEARRIAEKYAGFDNFLYLGRLHNFPGALEGALKLKEISYIHAEGYPAAEMKHGPIALVDEHTPSIFIAPHGSTCRKVASNIEEIKARRGPVIAIVDDCKSGAAELADDVMCVPRVSEFLQPIVTAIPLQLLAYHIAVLRGCDVDKPRNLAKSVTVE